MERMLKHSQTISLVDLTIAKYLLNLRIVNYTIPKMSQISTKMESYLCDKSVKAEFAFNNHITNC